MTDYFTEMNFDESSSHETAMVDLNFMRLLRSLGTLGTDVDGNPFLSPPASKTVIDALPKVTADSDDVPCTICLKTFTETEKATKLPCNHFFHSPCILSWLAKTNTCPYCRYELKTDDESYERYREHKARVVQRRREIEILHDSMFS